MTQAELVLTYLILNSSITPARMTGKVYRGTMFGSEISRTCRRLRAEGLLTSKRVGRFEVFSNSETE